MTGEGWLALHEFMCGLASALCVFPYMETLDGYAALPVAWVG